MTDRPMMTYAELYGDDISISTNGTNTNTNTSTENDQGLPPPSHPVAVARTLVAHEYPNRTIRHWRGGWWTWQGSHWTEVEHGTVRAGAYRFTENAMCVEEDGKVKRWAPNRRKVADLLEAAQAVTHLSEHVDQPAWIDGADGPPAGELVACSNGLLHVPTRKLHPHNPRFFNQVAVPFAYDPSPPVPERWFRFLHDLWGDDGDAINALQEWMGYVLSGRTDLHKILLLVGPTRAGKGVIGRVLASLVGRRNVTGPTLASLGQNFGLQDLIGKPLAVISDARLGGANTHTVVERLLSVSGEDTLTIDRKYRDPWTGKLSTRFVIISNELPTFGDASGAVANRFVVLTLARSWLGAENPALTG